MNNKYKLIEKADHWLLELQNRKITGCLLNYAFNLQLHQVNALTIMIGVSFIFVDNGIEASFDPKLPTTLGPVLSILDKEVESATAYKSGRLEINFTDGSYLAAEPDDQYEAWEIMGERASELDIVCLIGGGVAVWNS